MLSFSFVLLFCEVFYKAGEFNSDISKWDVSEVTNMKDVFFQFGSFNADLSKWNTGAVTSMYGSKCTFSPSLWPRLPLLCILNIRQLEYHRITILTRFVILFCVFETVPFLLFVVGWSFFSLLHPLMQCFFKHLRSIRTCQNGIRVR